MSGDTRTAPAGSAPAGPASAGTAAVGPARRLRASAGRLLGRVTQDWAANADRPESRVLLVGFRCAQVALASGGVPGRVLARTFYWSTYVLYSSEFPPTLEVGPGLRLHHPHGIVLNPYAEIGSNCLLRHNVTVGNISARDGTWGRPARIHDDVELGASCIVIGDIDIGSGARIGAGAVVVRSVPPGATAVGNPAVVRPPRP